MNRKIITEDETLLMFDTTRFGNQYVGESTSFGKSYTVDMLLDEPGDSCFRILILNTKTLKSTDATEWFAQEWLKRADGQPDGIELDDEDRFPTYVRNSKAWALWRDDLQAETHVKVGIYSTLDARTQGIARANR